MRLYLSGAENPSWRQLLEQAQASSVALSYNTLRVRLPSTKPYLLSERFSSEVSIALEAGDIGKRGLEDDELDEWAETYHDLVERNSDSLMIATEIDAYTDPDRIEENRELFWKHIPAFLPTWHTSTGHAALDSLCQGWDGVALPASALDDTRVRSILQRHVNEGSRVHALGLSRLEDLIRMPVTSASTAAWTAPTRYGETVFWDGQRLRRHPASYKDEATKRYRSRIITAGFDFDAVAANDSLEVTRLAIWSFQQLEAQVRKFKREPTSALGDALNTGEEEVPATEVRNEGDNEVQEPPTGPVTEHLPVRNPAPRERTLLPIMSSHQEDHIEIADDGSEGTVTRTVVNASGGRSVLACDTCHLAAICPESTPGASCAYEIPVRLRTQDDLQNLLNSMLEIQAKRVLLSRFAEELEGGLPSRETSREMAALFSLTEKLRDIFDNREYIKASMEVRGNSGVLSRIFGSSVGDAQTQLSEPIDTAELTSGVVEVPVQ